MKVILKEKEQELLIECKKILKANPNLKKKKNKFCRFGKTSLLS